MRKLLIILGILVICGGAIVAAWIVGGRQLSLFIDRFGTIEIDSAKVNSIAYEGGGTGGILIINDARLSLNEAAPNLSPSIGSTKDNQFALASGAKVFAFGPLVSSDRLATVPPAGDNASIEIRRSAVSWPTPFDFNFMTGHSPSWKRHLYYRVHWRKPNGATLEMLWRYEQFFYGQQLVPGTGWGTGFMTHQGSTGLIRLDIRQ